MGGFWWAGCHRRPKTAIWRGLVVSKRAGHAITLLIPFIDSITSWQKSEEF